jgi:hypothetical protein
MKISKYLFLFIAMIFIACTTNKKSELIAKNWVIGNINFGIDLPEDTKLLMEQMIGKSKATSYFNFRKDYTYEAFAIGMHSKGVWKLNDAGSELFLMDKKTQREERIKILLLTPDSLVLSAESQGQPVEMTFIPLKK